MRKVKTAMDTSIRSKQVRSFRIPGKARGHPAAGQKVASAAQGYAARRYASLKAKSAKQEQGGQTSSREDVIEAMPAHLKRQFLSLPPDQQEELLEGAQQKAARRYAGGRYDLPETSDKQAGRFRTPYGRERPLPGTDRDRRYLSGAGRYRRHEPLPDERRSGVILGSTGGFNPDSKAGESKGGRPRDFSANKDLKEPPLSAARETYRQEHALSFQTPGIEERARAQSGQAEPYPNRTDRKEIKQPVGGDVSDAHTVLLRETRNQWRRGQDAEKQRNVSHAGTDAGHRNLSSKSGIGDEKSSRSHGKNVDRKRLTKDVARELSRLVSAQSVQGSARQEYRREQTIKALEEQQARRIFLIIKKAAGKTAAMLKAAQAAIAKAAARGKIYLALLLAPVLFIVMIIPLLLSSLSTTMDEKEAVASATAMELVGYAAQWIGVTKYVWGEGRAYETDWQDYTDCSGFVHGVFSHFGYEIGGDTISMEGSGRLIGTNFLSDALPGDIILFFSNGILPDHSTHVGIYCGDGNMIHCSGGRANTSPVNAGPGVMISPVANDSRGYQIRRIIEDSGSLGGTGSGGHRVDPTNYSASDMQLIWAIVAQEDNGSYEGALAVISSAMNRTESPVWSYLGNTAMKQLCAPGQYCYSNDTYWQARLGGNVPEYVKQAVQDCLKKGIRNHQFTCFRSTKGKTTGPDAVQIGGNWFFGN